MIDVAEVVNVERNERIATCTCLITGLLLLAVSQTGCATNLGTGGSVVDELVEDYPITVGHVVEARMDTKTRLRVYIDICEEADEPLGCIRGNLRLLAMVEAHKKGVLERLANRYLLDGKDKPIYVYGPLCEGLEEMILVPRCQLAVAISVWDPDLKDYIVYSTLHGDGALVDRPGFQTFLGVTGKAANIARKALTGI